MEDDKKQLLIFTAYALFMFLGIVLFMWLLAALYAEYAVWSKAKSGEALLKEAEWTRQITVKEAQAKFDSSSLLAKSEIERAKGVAEANKIIGNSLKGNEAYLRYLWIDSLQHTQDKVIYVPTENGLPILEAGKR